MTIPVNGTLLERKSFKVLTNILCGLQLSRLTDNYKNTSAWQQGFILEILLKKQENKEKSFE